MKRLFTLLLLSCMLFSCNDDDAPQNELYLMCLYIDVVDSNGTDLLGYDDNCILTYGSSKAVIRGEDRYWNISDPYNPGPAMIRFPGKTRHYLMIGDFPCDVVDEEVIIDWGEGIEKDVLVFSYDSGIGGVAEGHSIYHPYHMTINGKTAELNEEGHYVIVKDMNTASGK